MADYDVEAPIGLGNGRIDGFRAPQPPNSLTPALVCEVPRSERSVCRVPVAGFPISGSSMLIGGLLLGLLSRPFPGKNLPFLSRPPWRRYNLIRE